ncbi:PaaI family thioesterase [Gordonia sp. (in: high G+C Gram-positive bacteria)]|uniref:PaaI family thioesterase n=1 Tax=Gordonia sp. (in: high G+C Gram-positive bacteria) TaxID=84139 RepID=UPI0026296505|nr:PaaI family thioesterase [Gordonia sp. (in: high G+C Gram-positive bacteria)]HMS74872.1 PaaI family thioesterase [Gordonia sp. (in: high G+C Gram-positive bacteria)]
MEALPKNMPNWWDKPAPVTVPEGYAEFVEQFRVLQDVLTAAAPDAEQTRTAAGLVAQLIDVLAPAETDEWSQLSGRLNAPGRGQTLVPVVHVESETETQSRGTVRFGRHYLGGNNAAHGGAIPLLFDDALGRFANSHGRPIARTAYLHVDYRSVTPVDTDLDVIVRFDREEGRKRYLTGEIRHGERLCAEAHGLFVVLRPGSA